MPIVPARRGDLDAIVALEMRSFPPEDRFARSTWRHLLGPAARRRSSLTLVARQGGRVVGAVNGLLRAGSRILRIYSLAVDPSQRGRGLGGRLILALVAAAPRRCTTVSLEVRYDNSGARMLYERLGFAVHERLPAYYPDGGAGIRYRALRSALRPRVA
jgi:ribosomal protein S18 acetylase RimI-like enzyme